MNRFLRMLKNCWIYVVFSTVTLFCFSVKYFISLQLGLAIMFVAYYFTLKFLADLRHSEFSLKTYLGDVLISYLFSLSPLLVWIPLYYLK